MKKIYRICGALFYAAAVTFMLWIGASFMDIIEDNNTTAEHNNYNLFVLINEIEG
jgi:hypothetical protein